MASKSIEFNGKRFATQMFNSFSSKLDATESELEQYLNVAALQAVRHGNTNWLNIIFEARAFRLKNGNLNKSGTDVLEYVKAHCPVVLFDVNEQRVKLRKITAKNKLNGMFRVPFESFTDDDTGEKLDKLVSVEENPVFALTLSEYRDHAANESNEAPKASDKKYSTLVNQLEGMAKLLAGEKESKVIGTVDELATIFTALESVHTALAVAITRADVKGSDVEETFNEQSESVSGKAETRADHDREALGQVA